MDKKILIDKPSSMTSFGVVARVRRVLSKEYGKKVKVGHTGTLDPFATGLLILVTGRMCKKAQQFSKLDKVYQAEFILGKESSTGDPEGEITDISKKKPTLDDIKQVLSSFEGRIKQKPPIFSAIKINGKRAYQLARDGQEVEIPERTIEIYSIKVIQYKYPKLEIEVHVSSGTYIRSLAVDVGKALGTGAYCSNLRRVKVGDYNVNESIKLGDLGIES